MLIPAHRRDKANGLFSTATGVSLELTLSQVASPRVWRHVLGSYCRNCFHIVINCLFGVYSVIRRKAYQNGNREAGENWHQSNYQTYEVNSRLVCFDIF